MDKVSLEEWLRDREPRIPALFLPHLLELGEGPFGGDGSSMAMGFSARGTAALSRSIKRPGRDRGAAFQLLASDAFLTYACEAAVREGDTLVGLEGILEQLGDRFR